MVPAKGQTKRKLTPAQIAAIAAAVAFIAPFTMKRRASSRSPTSTPHVLTVCYGETEGIEDRICKGRMRDPHARPHGKGLCSDHHAVPACTGRDLRRAVLGTLIDAGYNAGPGGVCSSPAAQYIRAGNWTKARNALRGWYVTARNRKTGVRVTLPGLVNRRNEEADICLKGLP
jgi:GH24 family phage-related lysozyme (muramidase)